MKRLIFIILLIALAVGSRAQADSILHHGYFTRGKMFMSSKQYKPDKWEQSYYETAIKTAFPSDLLKSPDKFKGKLVHLIGIIDSVFTDSSGTKIDLVMDNKFWDYIEDYSIQDEVMFVSPKGDGKFIVTLANANPANMGLLKTFPFEKKLFFVYGNFTDLVNNVPEIEAVQLKYIDYAQYTTAVFSYDIKRNKNGEIETDKKGKIQTTDFHFLKIAKAGQNK